MSIENNPEIDAIFVPVNLLDEQLANMGRDPEWGLPPKRMEKPTAEDLAKIPTPTFEEIRREIDRKRGYSPFSRWSPKLKGLSA